MGTQIIRNLLYKDNGLKKISGIPNLQAWYEVFDPAAITLSGSTLVSLKDKSGNGRHMTTTNTAMPLYSATGGSNNLAYLSIDSTHSVQCSGTISAGVIVYALIKVTTLSGASTSCIIGYSGALQGIVQDPLATGFMPIGTSGGFDSDNFFTNSNTTNWQLVIFNTLNTLGFTTVNNEPYGQRGHSYGATGITSLNIGFGASTASFQISALIVVNNTISQANDSLIRSYLLSKAAISAKPQIHYYGDSTTAGSGASVYTNCFAALVAANKGKDYTNNGGGGTIVFPNNGSTGVPGFNFIDLYLNEFQYNTFYDGQYIILDFGINDATQGGINATWKSTYQSYIQYFIDNGTPANKIIINIPASTAARQATMSAANGYIAAIASALGIQIYDANAAFAQNPALFFDTLHPNDAGYAVWAGGLEALIT